MTQDACEHKFIYSGVKYEIQEWKLPGSGAQPIYYYDWFYCEKCLDNKYQKLNDQTDTYSSILYRATPKGTR